MVSSSAFELRGLRPTVLYMSSFSGRLRACANRSWSAIRSALPTVVGPGFSDEPPHDNDHVGKGDPEVDHSPFPLGAPHQLLVGVAPRVGSFYDPPFRRPERGGLALLGDYALQTTFLQKPSSDVRVVGPIEVNTHRLGQPSQRWQSIQGSSQERRVVAVRRGSHRSKRDTFSIHHRRALEAAFPAIHRISACFLSSTRSLLWMQQSTATSARSRPIARS